MGKVKEQYYPDVRTAMLASAAMGPIGAFLTTVDISSIATIWGTLLVDIARKEGFTMSKTDAVKVCTGVLLGAGGYYAGCKAATKLFNALPGAGTVIAMGCSSVENIVFTYYFAVALIALFSSHTKDDVYNMVTLAAKIFRHCALFDIGEMAKILLFQDHSKEAA